MMVRIFIILMALVMTATLSLAQQGPLRIEITEGVIEPLPFATPNFVAENGSSVEMGAQLARVVAADLQNTGLFREIPATAYISNVTDFGSVIQYPDWKAINAQALVTGAVNVSGNNLTVKFRLYDIFSGAELGNGLQFQGTTEGWRRMAHKVADAVYSRVTGEAGYFDSRVVSFRKRDPKISVKSVWQSWIMMVLA